ncbi:MAG TPA: hypothetical protein V6C97_12120 [Oculatellaceae cyanobacterium]
MTVSESWTNEKYEGFEIWCALVPRDQAQASMQTDSFDLRTDDGYPGFNGSEQATSEYFSYGQIDGTEPFCFRRDFHDLKPDYVELSQEFRHYHNLYEEKDTGKFIKIFRDGTEEEVASIVDSVIRVRTKELRQFLAAKNMVLSMSVFCSRYADFSIEELGVEHSEKLTVGDDITFYLTQRNEYGDKKALSVVRAKKLIEPFPRERCGIWPFPENHEKKASTCFIVASSQGEDIEASCDLRSTRPKAWEGKDIYLRSVFFKPEVMSKYHSQPEKYSVTDGYFSCGNLWGMEIDNNREDGFISAYLGDLNKLPYKEQQHWKLYNVAPKGGISATAFARDFDCQFAAPTAADHVFNWKFEEQRKAWTNQFGWTLFKPLHEDDEHRTIHIPLNKTDWEAQVINLSMILIESINEKELDLIRKPDKDDRGITKLQKFLQTHTDFDFSEDIKVLRNLRDLRNGCGSHRKGEGYFAAEKFFKADKLGHADSFSSILTQCSEFLEKLRDLVDHVEASVTPAVS